MLSAGKYFEESNQSLEGINPAEFIELLEPKLEYELSIKSLSQRLHNDETLKVKLGIDPTGPDIHIGHVVPVRMLDLFSRAGHKIDLIFGDFTAKIGDPSGRSSGRKAITDEEIARNVSSYREQVHNYFDTAKSNVTIHRNSQWLGKLVLPEVFEYLQMVNLSEATQRKDFRERMSTGGAVTLSEAMYGTLQGIDSVYLSSDVEIGGIDQLLNVQQARNVQRAKAQQPEEVFLTPIIEGTQGDGRKMSKSYNNYIAAKADAPDIFGKIMSIPDAQILPYAKAFAPVRNSDLELLAQSILNKPLESKKQLGTFIVALSQGSLEEGLRSREEFERKFSRRQINDEDMLPIVSNPGATLLETLSSTSSYSSRSELRRIARAGGIKVNGKKITEDMLQEKVLDDSHISIGKRAHFKISLTEKT